MKWSLVSLSALTSTLLFAQGELRPIVYEQSEVPTAMEKREWTMTYSTGVGYRRDRQKMSDPQRGSSFQFTHFDTLQALFDITFAWDRLLIRGFGDYGWLADGRLSAEIVNTPLTPTPQTFTPFPMGSGYSCDVGGSLGCSIKLWAPGHHCFSFIPALGYLYTHWNAFPQKHLSNHDTTWLAYTRPYQQDWMGPLTEGRVSYSWKNAWHIECYYQYLPLDFHQTAEYLLEGRALDGMAFFIRERISANSHSARTQLGGIDLFYRSPAHWRVGVHFDGSCTWTHTVHTKLYQENQELTPIFSQSKSFERIHSTIHWVRYALNVNGSYWF